MLVTRQIGLRIATWLADIGFWWTGLDIWAAAALWALGAAIIGAALAATAGLIDFLGDTRIRNVQGAWNHAITTSSRFFSRSSVSYGGSGMGARGVAGRPGIIKGGGDTAV